MEIEQVLEKLYQQKCYARANFIPVIRDKSAVYLYNFVRDNGYKNILEIGTAIGYSGNIILSAGATHLTTIDINEDFLKRAKNNFEVFDNLDKVTIINKDAKIALKDLLEKKQKFDMVFLDGAKGQYIAYLSDLTNLLEKNGVIFADNVLLGGMVESNTIIPHKKRTMVVNLRKYLKVVGTYPFETELVRLEDGIAITKVKGE